MLVNITYSKLTLYYFQIGLAIGDIQIVMNDAKLTNFKLQVS